MVLVPILHGTRPEDLPADLKHYICLETTETSFWPRLFKALVGVYFCIHVSERERRKKEKREKRDRHCISV